QPRAPTYGPTFLGPPFPPNCQSVIMSTANSNQSSQNPKPLVIDTGYLKETLFTLLEIPSPSGYTDRIVHWVGEELTRLNIPFELTRRGAIRANLRGLRKAPARAVVSHVDTLGAMVKNLKE